MQHLLRIADGIDRLNEWIGRKVSWLTLLLVIIFCVDVVARYLFGKTAVWVMELEWHLFSILFLLAAAYTLQHDRHVRVDVFYDRFSERDKAWVNLTGHLLLLIPWTLILIWSASGFAWSSFVDGEGSPDPGGLPARWIVKSAIVLGMLLLLLQAISGVIRAGITIKHN